MDASKFDNQELPKDVTRDLAVDAAQALDTSVGISDEQLLGYARIRINEKRAMAKKYAKVITRGVDGSEQERFLHEAIKHWIEQRTKYAAFSKVAAETVTLMQRIQAYLEVTESEREDFSNVYILLMHKNDEAKEIRGAKIILKALKIDEDGNPTGVSTEEKKEQVVNKTSTGLAEGSETDKKPPELPPKFVCPHCGTDRGANGKPFSSAMAMDTHAKQCKKNPDREARRGKTKAKKSKKATPARALVAQAGH